MHSFHQIFLQRSFYLQGIVQTYYCALFSSSFCKKFVATSSYRSHLDIIVLLKCVPGLSFLFAPSSSNGAVILILLHLMLDSIDQSCRGQYLLSCLLKLKRRLKEFPQNLPFIL